MRQGMMKGGLFRRWVSGLAYLLTTPGCAALPPAAVSAPANAAAPADLGYADLADLVLPATSVADVRIVDARTVDPERAPGVAPGRVRLYVEAELLALIRGARGAAPVLRFLVDVPADARGRPPRVEKGRFLVFGTIDAARPGELRLVAPDAMIGWSPDGDAAVRAIVQAAVDGNAPPAVTGIASAFHVPGTVIGESETQIFLATDTGAPVSVSVVRRPGKAPRWGAAFGEVVDEAAGAPARDTLAWYRLACGLPKALPAEAVSAETPDNADAVRQDYQAVLRDLGPCA